MPSTRGGGRYEAHDDLPNDSDEDEFDPDYCETESDEEDCPKRALRDRAEWVVQHIKEIEPLYRCFLEMGRDQMGNAFFQTGNITAFAHFLYRYTTPLSE